MSTSPAAGIGTGTSSEWTSASRPPWPLSCTALIVCGIVIGPLASEEHADPHRCGTGTGLHVRAVHVYGSRTLRCAPAWPTPASRVVDAVLQRLCVHQRHDVAVDADELLVRKPRERTAEGFGRCAEHRGDVLLAVRQHDARHAGLARSPHAQIGRASGREGGELSVAAAARTTEHE